MGVYLTQAISAAEKETIEGLQKAGFKLEFGVEKAGLLRLYMTRGGGYYIDVGCSQLIIDGKIKVKQSPEGITGFKPNALVLKDGSELEADVVVLATGYDNMRTTVRKILGDKVADRCRDVWDLDEEGEINAVSLKLIFSYLIPIQVLARSSLDLYISGTNRLDFNRYGERAATPVFGIWVVISPCVVYTLNFWLSRSRRLKKAWRLNRCMCVAPKGNIERTE